MSKVEIKELENRMREIPKEIKELESEKKSINEELENAKLEAELQNNEVAYYEILIRELVEEYGAEGEEMFKEMYPTEAEEILKAKE